MSLKVGGNEMERLLTPREAAEYMAVAPRTIKEWLRKGELSGLKIKNMWRIRKSDLEQFIHQGTPLSFRGGEEGERK